MKLILEIIGFTLFGTLALALIDTPAPNYIVDAAGDILGMYVLMTLGAYIYWRVLS